MFYVDDIRVYFKYSIWLLILSQLQASYVCSMQTQFQLIPIPALLHIMRFAKIKARWVKARWQGRLNGTLNRPLAFDTRLKSNIEPELISPMIHTWWSRLHWPSNWTQKRPFQLFMSWIFLECCPLCWIFLSYYARGFFHPRWTTVRHEHVT